jgi:hypothetical protein
VNFAMPVPKRRDVIIVGIIAIITLSLMIPALVTTQWGQVWTNVGLGGLALWLACELQTRRIEHGREDLA